MTIEQLEAAVAAQINELGLMGKPYPDPPANDLPQTQSEILSDAQPSEVWVRYTGRTPQPCDVSGVAVAMSYHIELIYTNHQLRGEDGLYQWLERVSERLEGYTIEGAAGWLELIEENLLTPENGTWQFSQKWQLKTTQHYEQQDPYADRPLGA